MKSTKLLLIGAAMVLGSGTAIVQAQTQPAIPATRAAPASPADPSAGTAATPAVKATPAEPAVPAASSADTAGLQKSASASASEPLTPPVKGKSRKKPQ